MKKKTIYILLLIFLFNFEYSKLYSSEQKCISSNGVPNHEIGNFPIKGNPNKFKERKLKFCFTKNPKKTNTNKYIAATVGVTLTGIPIRPGTAAWYDKNAPKKHSQDKSSGLNLEAIRPFEKILGIDEYNGHLDFRGLYHYHKPNTALIFNDQNLIGYAADGFEIFYIPGKFKSSWQLKKGNRTLEPYGIYDGSFKEDYEFVKASGDLDECNGKSFKGAYRYFATDKFPYFPRCHWGKISKDFREKR